MKNKITRVLEATWDFCKTLIGLVVIAAIFSFLLFLGFVAVFGALWCFDAVVLGGAIFG